MKYWKVQIGYGADSFISVDESELEMALRAQITGRVGVFKEGTVTGKNIVSITPDYNRMEGYRRDYKMTGEDYDRIPKTTLEEYRNFLGEKKKIVNNQVENTQRLLD